MGEQSFISCNHWKGESMPELNQPASRTTQINHIKVLPENQGALVRAMTENLDRVMAPAPGFVSSTILRSIDGERVVNVVQWTTPEIAS